MLVPNSLKAPVHSPAKHEEDEARGLLEPAQQFQDLQGAAGFLVALGKGQEGLDLVRSGSSTKASHRRASPATVPDTLASGGSRAVPTGLPLGRTSAAREGQSTASEYRGV